MPASVPCEDFRRGMYLGISPPFGDPHCKDLSYLEVDNGVTTISSCKRVELIKSGSPMLRLLESNYVLPKFKRKVVSGKASGKP